jgi:hypothetical protein
MTPLLEGPGIAGQVSDMTWPNASVAPFTVFTRCSRRSRWTQRRGLVGGRPSLCWWPAIGSSEVITPIRFPSGFVRVHVDPPEDRALNSGASGRASPTRSHLRLSPSRSDRDVLNPAKPVCAASGPAGLSLPSRSGTPKHLIGQCRMYTEAGWCERRVYGEPDRVNSDPAFMVARDVPTKEHSESDNPLVPPCSPATHVETA